jgi:hypothetical protein
MLNPQRVHGDGQHQSTVLARLQRYRAAGVTDLAARVVPVGSSAAERAASRERTTEFLASLCRTL